MLHLPDSLPIVVTSLSNLHRVQFRYRPIYHELSGSLSFFVFKLSELIKRGQLLNKELTHLKKILLDTSFSLNFKIWGFPQYIGGFLSLICKFLGSFRKFFGCDSPLAANPQFLWLTCNLQIPKTLMCRFVNRKSAFFMTPTQQLATKADSVSNSPTRNLSKKSPKRRLI